MFCLPTQKNRNRVAKSCLPSGRKYLKRNVSDISTPSCVDVPQAASLANEPTHRGSKSQVAGCSFRTGTERRECGRILPGARIVCTAVLLLEKIFASSRDAAVRGGASCAG